MSKEIWNRTDKRTVREIVLHYLADEKKHWEENDKPDNHIYHQLEALWKMYQKH